MSQLYRSIAALYLRQARKWRRLQSSAKRHLGGAHRGQSYVEMVFTVLGVAVVIITAIEGSIVLNRGIAVKQLAYRGARYAAANPGFTSATVLAFVSQAKPSALMQGTIQVSMSPNTAPRTHGTPHEPPKLLSSSPAVVRGNLATALAASPSSRAGAFSSRELEREVDRNNAQKDAQEDSKGNDW